VQMVDYAAVVGDAWRSVEACAAHSKNRMASACLHQCAPLGGELGKGKQGERWKEKIEIKTKDESRNKAFVGSPAEIAPS
jgi:hypothetical protein